MSPASTLFSPASDERRAGGTSTFTLRAGEKRQQNSLSMTPFLTAAGKYRLHSMASLVAVLVHAGTMPKVQKEMYPSLSQLQGRGYPLLFITTGEQKTDTA